MEPEKGDPSVRVDVRDVADGFRAAGAVLDDTVLFHGSLSSMGTVAGGPATVDYLSRVMPFMGRIGARWDDVEHGRFWAETDVVYAADADRLSLADQGDTQRIPPGGTPSWTVWNVRAGWHVSESATLFAALDNILDEDYRVHGSGSNMPGRNFIVAVQATF